ncbi:hypothetical protein GHO30_21680, partial [Pseudomonas helleri]|nr:hypothetical protein [Pseudomonas helleri]
MAPFEQELADEAEKCAVVGCLGHRWQLVFDLGDGKPQLYEFSVEDFLP